MLFIERKVQNHFDGKNSPECFFENFLDVSLEHGSWNPESKKSNANSILVEMEPSFYFISSLLMLDWSSNLILRRINSVYFDTENFLFE